jgi:hypothetical protein
MRGNSYADKNGKEPPKGHDAKGGTSRRSKQHVVTPADWGGVSAELLREAIQAITQHGAAIRFGYTRDMGAYAIGFYENGSSETEYVPPSEDMDLWLKGVIEDYGK